MKPPAPCGHVHPSDMARAVDRFNPSGPTWYHPASDPTTIYATRAEAEVAECATRHTNKEQ